MYWIFSPRDYRGMITAPHIALMQALDLPSAEAGGSDWIQLLPPGPQVHTADNRGPYMIDAAAIVAAAEGQQLPIDENHAIDIKGPRGESTPAVGRIVEVEARADGSIWGRAEWNSTGQHLMSERAYVGVSPVIRHTETKVITAILRASLTNKPNLRGMTALHMENDMSFAAVAKALGLADDATEEQILTKINARKADTGAVALQSQLGQIGVALGVAEGAAPEAVLAAAKAVGQADDKKAIVALQAELADVTTRLNTISESGAKVRAEAFVDGAIKRGHVGVKPLRDHYIAMHMQDAGRVEKEIGAMPVLGAGTSTLVNTPVKEGEIALQSEHIEAARALGIDPKTYAAALKADQEEAL